MSSDGRRLYCTLDHANKRRELADRRPYQFWLDQVRRGSAGRHDEAGLPAGRGLSPGDEGRNHQPAEDKGTRRRRVR